MSDEQKATRRVNCRVRQARYDEASELAKAEERSTSNMVDILLGEALAARKAKPKKEAK